MRILQNVAVANNNSLQIPLKIQVPLSMRISISFSFP